MQLFIGKKRIRKKNPEYIFMGILGGNWDENKKNKTIEKLILKKECEIGEKKSLQNKG